MDNSRLLLQNAPNFRDFGGLGTIDGRRIRAGRLYRSELLQALDAADHKVLRALDIGLICDLRSPGERQRLPSDWPANLPVQVLALDVAADLSSVQPDKWGARLRDPHITPAQARDAMIDNYRRMPKAFSKDLQALFEYLSGDSARGVVIHCAVGKDRTGFVSAMMLSALGASRESIMLNYELTSERYPPERMINNRAHFMPDLALSDQVRAALGMLVVADPAYLHAALETVENDFGSIDTYLEKACGLDVSLRQSLHRQLLE